MLIVFGWDKTLKPVESLLKTHCFHCNNDAKWSLWKETEWVSFFFINLIPFNNKYHLACEICGDGTEIPVPLAKKIVKPSNRTQELHDEVLLTLEDYQFKDLTEGQIAYRKGLYEQKRQST